MGYFDCTLIELNLESGGGTSNQMTRIGHREASNLDREDSQEEKETTV